MKNRYIKVDNPGGGDCGFYAFAICIIAQMQKDLSSNNYSDLIQQFLNSRFIHPDEDKFITLIKMFDFQKPNRNILELFNHLLRKELISYQVAELNQKRIFSCEAFNDAMAVFWKFYDKSADKFDLDNDFYRDAAFIKKVKDLVKLIKQYEENKYKELVGHKKLDAADKRVVQEEIFTLSAKMNIIAAVLFANESGSDIEKYCSNLSLQGLSFDEQSEAGRVLRRKKSPGIWATHVDLKSLAERYHVNLHVLINGKASISNGKSVDGWPIVYLNNANNLHWTSLLDKEKFKLKQNQVKDENAINQIVNDLNARLDSQQQIVCQKLPFGKIKLTGLKQEILTLNQIKTIFNSYMDYDSHLYRFFNLHWLSRNHIDIARLIVDECQKTEATVESLIKFIKEKFPHPCNPEGEFARSVRQVLTLYDPANAAQEMSKLLNKISNKPC